MVKKRFWLFRRRLYSGMRSVGLMLIVLIISLSYVVNRSNYDVDPTVLVGKKDIFLTGLFAPEQADGGLTPIDTVKTYQSKYKLHFDIVSFYIPWGDEQKCFVPAADMQKVYKNNSVPMISWEPWETLFANGQADNEKHVFDHIVKGRFDSYIQRFALQLKALNRPVFLRFAHEADNPFYPWSATGGNTPEQFKAAWKYVHDTK
jgi:cellulose synthase (UDP-forming)